MFLYLGISIICAILLNDFDVSTFYAFTPRWPPDGPPVFGSHFATWDAAHYLYLSNVGYKDGIPSCAFYPFWPLLIRWFSIITCFNHILVGIVLANVFSLLAFMIFYWNVRARYGMAVAKLALLLLLLYPGSLFYHFIYSEPIFLLLLMVLWFGLETNNCAVVAVAAFILPTIRAIGLFCVFPIFSFVLSDYINNQTKNAVKRNTWWLLIIPFLGWVCYLAMMKYWTGYAFEGFEAQKYWHVHSISNLWNVPKFLIGWLTPTSWHGFTGSILDRCAFNLLLCTLPMIWRLDKGLFIWAWWLGVVPAMSGTFVSFTRFSSTTFPMFIALSIFLNKPGQRIARWTVIVIFTALHLLLLWRFVNFRWAG